jgi:hypothetical protein
MSKLFPYRAETDPELIAAAAQAYLEAPPASNTETSVFAWSVGHRTVPVPVIGRGDRVIA